MFLSLQVPHGALSSAVQHTRVAAAGQQVAELGFMNSMILQLL